MSDRERRIKEMLYGNPGMTIQEAAEYYLGLEKGGLSSISKEGAQRHIDRTYQAGGSSSLENRARVGLREAMDADDTRIREMLYGDPGMTRQEAAEYYLGLEEGGLQSLSDKGVQRHERRTLHATSPGDGGLSTRAWLGLTEARDARQEAARQAARQAASLRWLEEPKR